MKKCRDCKEEKELKDFVKNHVFSDGIDTLCLVCNRKRTKAYRKKNPSKPHGKRKNMSAEYREVIVDFLIKRDGFVCGFCKKSLEDSKIHIDHLVPVALGGPSIMENLRLSHASCNLAEAIGIRQQIHGY